MPISFVHDTCISFVKQVFCTFCVQKKKNYWFRGCFRTCRRLSNGERLSHTEKHYECLYASDRTPSFRLHKTFPSWINPILLKWTDEVDTNRCDKHNLPYLVLVDLVDLYRRYSWSSVSTISLTAMIRLLTYHPGDPGLIPARTIFIFYS